MSSAPGMPDDSGWLPGCEWNPSPNADDRPGEELPSLVVLHAISLPPAHYGGSGILDFFLSRLDSGAHPYFASIARLRVSAHFLIRRDGQTIQFVNCRQRAWHAGVSQWRGRPRCNDYSIGIELEGSDEDEFAEAQYLALDSLLPKLAIAYPLTEVVGHADIAPGRKTDPGPRFDWIRIPRFRALMLRA